MGDQIVNNILDAIESRAKNISEILHRKKYEIDVFQREYLWQRKQMEDLIVDLSSKFLSSHKSTNMRDNIDEYSIYYLGSIIISIKGSRHFIIDGQQRLTSITLLLIYLNKLQSQRKDKVNIDDLIFSERYGQKTFNLWIDDRIECINALYKDQKFNSQNKSDSVKNMVERYDEIDELFPIALKDSALPFFIDWLLEKVIFVEILTSHDEDAYLIFETMNDRGLTLNSTEILKGYLFAKIESEEQKNQLNEIWIKGVSDIKKISGNADDKFFKSWLRAKYAKTLRISKDAENEDFEDIEKFHRWVKNNNETIGLQSKSDFKEFVKEKFDFYSKLYIKINDTSKKFEPNLEYIYYISRTKFPSFFVPPLLLAPIKITDDEATINKKLALVSRYIETFTVRRSVNRETLGCKSIRYQIYDLMLDIRDKTIEDLSIILKDKVDSLSSFEGMRTLRLNKLNKPFIHFLLARMTNYIEKKSKTHSSFDDYIGPSTAANPHEIEHIWPNRFADHKDEFSEEDYFDEYRNRFGALILIPKGTNQSLFAEPFEAKQKFYYGQNLLAQSLCPLSYEKNPNFIKFLQTSGLPFEPPNQFKKQDIEKRQILYQKICEKIWHKSGFDEIATI